MTGYIEFKEVGFSADGKTLKIVFDANTAHCMVSKVYISTQDTWKSNDSHSDNYIELATNWTTSTPETGVTRYTLNDVYSITTQTPNPTIKDFVVASVTINVNLESPLELPCNQDTTLHEIAIYNPLLLRLNLLKLIDSIECCTLPRELINGILTIDSIEIYAKVRLFLKAIKLRKKSLNTKSLTSKKSCSCGN